MKKLIMVLLVILPISLTSLILISNDAINFKEDSQAVEGRDLAHLVLLSNLIDGHTEKTGALPENIVDDEGRLLLSWRVLILQYGSDEEVAQFNRFKLDEPWDSEHNRKVAEKIPECYVDPAGSQYTPYLGVSGETNASSRSRPIDDVKNQARDAIVTVDTAKVKCFWTEPKDASPEKVKSGESLRWRMNQTLYMNTEGSVRSWEKGEKISFYEHE